MVKLVAMIGSNGGRESTALKAVFSLVKLMGEDVLFQGETIAGLRQDQLVLKVLLLLPRIG